MLSASPTAKDIEHDDIKESNVSPDDGPPCLTNLPPELMEHIANHVTPHDLSTLRLVSRDIREKIFRAFTKVLFSERAFLLSDRSSMNMLYAISRHKTFARYVEHIRFSPLTLRDDFEFKWQQESPISTTSLRDADSQVISLYQRMKEDENRFCRRNDLTNSVHGVLICIFAQFKRLGHYPNISFIEPYKAGDHARYRPCGIDRLREALRAHLLLDDCMAPAPDSRYHEAVFKTVLKLQYAPRELEIGQFSHEMGIEVLSYRLHQFPGKNLRTLRLTLASWNNLGIYTAPVATCPARHQELHNLATIFANVPQLANLKLHSAHTQITVDRSQPWRGGINRDIFHCLATRSHLDGTVLDLPRQGILLPRLESLDLGHHAIEFDLFLRFCRERRETLRKLKLVHLVDHKQMAVEHRIREALGATHRNGDLEFTLSLENCFDGSDEL